MTQRLIAAIALCAAARLAFGAVTATWNGSSQEFSSKLIVCVAASQREDCVPSAFVTASSAPSKRPTALWS